MHFTTIRTRALCEQERRRNQSSTFTEPLEILSQSSQPSNDVNSFLEEFNRTIGTPEQKAKNESEMEEHPILKLHFEILVPKIVSYEDFWMRYYLRCYDLNRIASELTQQDERKEYAKQPEEMKNTASADDIQSSVSVKESFESVQDRILYMASSPARVYPKKEEKEKAEKEGDSNLSTTFDSSLTFGSASFNVIPIDARTQTKAESTSEKPREFPLFPVDKEEAEYRRIHSGGDNYDDNASVGSISMFQLPDNMSEVTSVVSNPDHIHRYPESPDFCDQSLQGESIRAQAPATEPQAGASDTDTASALDDRLAGANIFILNEEVLEEKGDLTSKITDMGGKVTEKLKIATHALWVPPITETEGNELELAQKLHDSWSEFKDTVIVTMAENHDVPIVDSDRWLPQIERLEFEEHWSDVNSKDFHPERTIHKMVRSSARNKTNQTDEQTSKERYSEAKKRQSSRATGFQVFAFANVLIVWVVALLIAQSSMFFPSKRLPKNPQIQKRHRWSNLGASTKHARKSRQATNGKKTVETMKPWWKRLFSRSKAQNQ